MNRWLIGIDDTDSLESRGTGHLARQLARSLESAVTGLNVAAVTRHQLLVDPRIAYTSHNSSACMVATFHPMQLADVVAHAAGFLLAESAAGSDAGLCVAEASAVSPAVVAFGQKAKREVLALPDATGLAASEKIYLEGLTGTLGGQIGALAAVGLHASGNDGRFLWLPGLREISGQFSSAQLYDITAISRVETVAGQAVAGHELIDMGEWVRPILKDHLAVLLVEEIENGNYRWRVAARDRIKELSA